LPVTEFNSGSIISLRTFLKSLGLHDAALKIASKYSFRKPNVAEVFQDTLSTPVTPTFTWTHQGISLKTYAEFRL
jgi:hypothetical protein